MKRRLLITVLLSCLLDTQAQEARIFDDYEELYASLPDRMFTGSGRPLSVSAGHGVRIMGKNYGLQRASAFLGESIYADDLGRAATLYTSDAYWCVEGAGAASGTASRHISVYLIHRKDGQTVKLPSLFGSCLGIARHADGNIGFLQARIINYRAAYDADGVSFHGYQLVKDSFVPTDVRLEVQFLAHDNFYRFKRVK